jgi:glutamate racemase
MGREVVLVDSADATAFRVRQLLIDAGTTQSGSSAGAHRFESSGDVEAFRGLGRQLLGPELDEVTALSWPE